MAAHIISVLMLLSLTGLAACAVKNDVQSLISEKEFNSMFPHRNHIKECGRLYTYNNFVCAANEDKFFLKCGTMETRKLELAAFLAQISQETTGWWKGQPYDWGLCFCKEVACDNTVCNQYCEQSSEFPCAANKDYFGRGPIQLSYNYNYAQASQYLYKDDRLLKTPELVIQDGKIAFKTAIWYWMTPQYNKPSCHAVMTGNYVPSEYDLNCGRKPGFGLTTNIINGGNECQSWNKGNQASFNRQMYFETYCKALNVSPGINLSCDNMLAYNQYCKNETSHFPKRTSFKNNRN